MSNTWTKHVEQAPPRLQRLGKAQECNLHMLSRLFSREIWYTRPPQQNDMPPGSPPSEGFRESLKHRARRVRKWLGSEDQAPTPRTSSPQPPLQYEIPPSHIIPTHPTSRQPSAQTQGSKLRPHLATSAGGSTSTANLEATDGVQSTDAESGLARAAKKVGADAWAGLKVALQLLERSSDAFPPLKSAVAGFLDVVDVFEAAAQNRSDYTKLALTLQAMVQEFAERPGEQTSSRMLEALDAMGNGLREEMKRVQKQGQRSRFKRFLEAKQDSDDVQACYKRVEDLRRALQDKAMLRMWRIGEEQQVDARLEKLDAALKATYNSKLSAVVGRRACTPGTRERILAGMREWASNPDSPKVYWLNGMAGTGKTTLAYSFCAEMQRAGRPGASFFCSRTDADSRDVSRIVPTIAYQLARLLPLYCEAVTRQIGEDKDICARETEMQFEKLIRDPLLELGASVPGGIVVTIDALDECDGRDGAQDVLNVLFLYARELPIKFLVTSRPEPGLFDALQSKDECHRSVLHLHDVEASFVQADIKTYLETELGAISLSKAKLEQLVKQAGTLFIYAATAVRYIHPKGRRVNFHQRLDDLLSVASQDGIDQHKGIDDLYTAVLAAPFADENLGVKEKGGIRLVLDTAICAREPMSVNAMAKLLELDEEDVICALQHLRSVLHISEGAGFISTLHASFPDFMLDHKRSRSLCCDATKHHPVLSLRCFSTMERFLRFNICELESSFDLDESIPDLTERIERAISPELFYACRYWADHLAFGEASDDVQSALEGFLSNRLLFWMEVLNLNRCIYIGARGLYSVQAWTQRTGCPADIRQLVRDAAGFVTMFSSNTVSRSTPHIYISALPFWPEQRPISKHYSQKTRGLPKASGTGMSRRESAPITTCIAPARVYTVACSSDGARIVSGSGDNTIHIWDAYTGKMIGEPLKGHTDTVWSVAYSSDGVRIASGSGDSTIQVWDAYTGKMIGEPLKGHTRTVWSVAWSSDGARIVSGSDDQTIRIWDAQTGMMIGEPLVGHTSLVRSVAYSSDGARIVSGSGDSTVRVWDALTGKMVGEPLMGHNSTVRSVTFSSDGARIVSGSADNTIRVWDTLTGKMIGDPFKGHTDEVNSVAYSFDDVRIVSGSTDRTIRVWDTQTGEMIGEPLKGHTGKVYSVACSSDGARIVSGSPDNTIRIWDAHRGRMIDEPLEGHTSTVCSVAFSSDGARIVSGSGDNTIQIWDARTRKMIGEALKGHTGGVNSVAYSYDDARIVSGSNDNTIRIWDARTGEMISEPLEGHADWVRSVAFSSDGARIVSGSDDKTIRIWDAYTGKMIGEPLKGHTNWVMSVAFSSGGARIVSGSRDNTIRVWDAQTGAMIGEPLKGHTKTVTSVAYSSDDARIVSGSDDKTIRIWDAYTGKMIGEPLEGHTNMVRSVAFSPDGARIVSGSNDKTIRIWDAQTGDMIEEPLEGHTNTVSSVAFSPDGAHIVSGSSDHTIRVTRAGYMSNDPSNSWVLDQDGFMLANGSKLLMWVPPDVRNALIRPQTTFVISPQGSVWVDFTDANLGKSWAQCYRST